MIGTFEVILNALSRRNHLASVIEASTQNRYRMRSMIAALRKDAGQPGYNPGLRFAEVEYKDAVSQGVQGYIYWIVPSANPGQRKLLYTVQTVQNWNPVGDFWSPGWVNGLRQ